MGHDELEETIEEHTKPKRTKEELDREYSHYAIMVGDSFIKMKHFEELMKDFGHRAVLVVQEAQAHSLDSKPPQDQL